MAASGMVYPHLPAQLIEIGKFLRDVHEVPSEGCLFEHVSSGVPYACTSSSRVAIPSRKKAASSLEEAHIWHRYLWRALQWFVFKYTKGADIAMYEV